MGKAVFLCVLRAVAETNGETNGGSTAGQPALYCSCIGGVVTGF